jgi:hypothetical protein
MCVCVCVCVWVYLQHPHALTVRVSVQVYETVCFDLHTSCVNVCVCVCVWGNGQRCARGSREACKEVERDVQRGAKECAKG